MANAEAAAHGQHHHPALAHHFDSLEQQAEASLLGMWVFLVTEILFFGGHRTIHRNRLARFDLTVFYRLYAALLLVLIVLN